MSNINDFEICGGILTAYNGRDKEVIIPDTVTDIGMSAFSKCAFIESIVIPDTVVHIYSHAFKECSGLKEIFIPSSVCSIEYEAFMDCKNLTKAVISDTVRFIDDGVFSGCEKLKDITFPVLPEDDLGENIFNGCYALADSEGFVIFEHYLYAYLGGKEEIVVPDGVTKIMHGAFSYNKKLRSVTVPYGVTYIGDNAFFGCKQLESVSMGDSVEAIGIGAFTRCTLLENISIPDSVKSIGEYAFHECTSLTGITVPLSTTVIKEMTFFNCKSLKTVRLHSSIKEIYEDAFGRCTSLTHITLPDSLELIEDTAFDTCTSLESVDFPNVELTLGKRIFNGCRNLADKDGFVIFNGCLFGYYGDSKKPVLPEGVTKILNWSFYCLPIRSISLPSTLIHIDCGFAVGCEDLTELIFPDKVKKFDGTVLEKVWNIRGNPDFSDMITVSVLSHLSESKLRSSSICRKLKIERASIVRAALMTDNTEVLKNFFALFSKIALADLDKYIFMASDAPMCRSFLISYKNEKYTQRQIDNAKELGRKKALGEIPYSITEYKRMYSFKRVNEGLVITEYKGDESSVVIPEKIGSDKVVEIGSYAFTLTRSLKDVTVPSCVSAIGEYAFSYCCYLNNVYVLNPETTIMPAAFEGCPDVVIHAAEDSYTEIYALTNKITFKKL
ncbi:MAG: leucine-rich repeat protein [Clostridia bacterium]|nr:leucine-rich repeat protein [Clostridia bacterium]